jgi:ketosteroid isomerase-like protein
MKPYFLPIALGVSLLVSGCTSTATRGASASYEAAVKTEVEQTIRTYFAGFSAASCTDGTAVSRFARDPVIYVLETEVFEVSGADYEDGVRQRACNWNSHGGDVDSVKVEAMSKDAALAAWTYHDDIALKTGVRRQTNGAVLMTLVKTPQGWKITSTKASEVAARK